MEMLETGNVEVKVLFGIESLLTCLVSPIPPNSSLEIFLQPKSQQVQPNSSKPLRQKSYLRLQRSLFDNDSSKVNEHQPHLLVMPPLLFCKLSSFTLSTSKAPNSLVDLLSFSTHNWSILFESLLS